MKTSIYLLASLAVQASNAHYVFGRLILDGKKTETWEYIRQVSPSKDIADATLALIAPNTNPDSLDLRCGRNASTSWRPVKTAIVQAGESVGFAAGEPHLERDEGPSMYHPGYASAWLSKVPDGSSLDTYTGDGDWFKIFQMVKPTEQSRNWESPEWKPRYDIVKSLWGTFLLDSLNFTIPAATPPGSYLLRFEHIFPNAVDAQYYVNCAHVVIENSDAQAKPPGPTVKIPGVYTRGQKDVYFSTYDLALANNLSIDSFVPPAPVVWGA